MVKKASGKSFKQQLGSGTYGVVHLVKRKSDNVHVALKTIDKTAAELKDDPSADQMLKDEIEVARMLDHPNCVKLFDVFDSKKVLHLASELCSGGEVFDAIINNLKPKTDGSGYEGVQYTERVGANMARQVC
jgi:serine/threonine protein kinase